MSRDDKRIALSLDDQVHVYELGNLYELGTRSIRKINLADQINSYPNRGSPELTPDDKKWKAGVERRVQFSVDGKNLVIATCVEDQFAYIDLWDCDVEPWSIVAGGFGLTRLPSVCYSIFWVGRFCTGYFANHIQWTSNGYLTSVFYDSIHHSIFLTAFLNFEYPLLLSMFNGEATSSPFNTQIIHAAQSPSGSRYAVASGTSEIHICDHKPGTTLNPIRIKKASSKIPSLAFRPGKLSLSFLRENALLVFWVKDERLMLRTIRLNESGEAVPDYDLREDYERLMAERVPSASSRAQSPGASLLSQPVLEVEAPTGSPRPDLHELATN